MLAEWGVRKAADAETAGVEWPTGRKAAKFKDIWSWETDVHEEWIDALLDTHPHIAFLIDNTRTLHSDGTAAYLAWMAVRLIECHRILKPTGSLYLHCDHSANGYLRMLLDAIFGQSCFQNEVIWSYGLGGSSPKRWSRKHDTILFYSKSEPFTFDKPTQPATSQMMKGREKGMTDVWTDIPTINNMSKERTGYPTQKPWALAERIIKASSDPGDVVFDPFAGCAYTAVAAEELGRQWIACDISPRSVTVLRRQFAKKGWSIDGEVLADEAGVAQLNFVDVKVKGPGDVPERAPDDVVAVPSVKPLPERKYKRRSSDMPRSEMVELLARLSDWACWGCGFAVRGPDGEVVETAAHFHLDHIEPKAEGGSNLLHNRAVLCSPCNTEKGRRTVRLKDFRRDPSVVARRKAYGIPETALCDLDEAQEQAMIEWSQWRASKGLDHPTLTLG